MIPPFSLIFSTTEMRRQALSGIIKFPRGLTRERERMFECSSVRGWFSFGVCDSDSERGRCVFIIYFFEEK